MRAGATRRAAPSYLSAEDTKGGVAQRGADVDLEAWTMGLCRKAQHRLVPVLVLALPRPAAIVDKAVADTKPSSGGAAFGLDDDRNACREHLLGHWDVPADPALGAANYQFLQWAGGI